MAKKIAILNFKGGVGKTTTAINLCAGLARMKKKALLIDLDAQRNATLHLGYEIGDGKTVFDALVDRNAQTELPIYTFQKNFDFVPANIMLSETSELLAVRDCKEGILQDLIMGTVNDKGQSVLRGVNDEYDYIIIDCPPGNGVLNTNALTAADGVIIPLKGDDYSLQGITSITERINIIRRRLNKNLQVLGFLFTDYDMRLSIHKLSRNEMKEAFPNKVFNSIIHRCVRFTETPSVHQTIFDYAPKCSGADDYMQLVKEVVKILKS